MFAGSGTVNLNPPDKFHATRDSDFASVEMIFDGRTLTLLDKNANLYGQIEMPFCPQSILPCEGLLVFISLTNTDASFLAEAKQRKTEEDCGYYEKQGSAIGML